MEDTESGFIGETDVAAALGNRMTDVEVLHVSQTNVVACGRRYGRMWLLKGLSPELRDSTTGLHRLFKEFEIHSRLCHPSVVQAINIEEIEGLGWCIVMEWVEGSTLADLLRDGKLSKKNRQRILHDTITAVEYLHRNGIVHRDLKPSNIMVRNAGKGICIIDFGLADTDSHTELKQSAGTPGFISPEQLIRGGADTADDVYSIGVMINEICPEYKRIARQCTGPYKDRPADAGALRRLMDRRRRRKRRMIPIVVAAFVLASGALAVRQFHLLGDAARQSESRVESLRLENKRREEHIRILSDSLSNMHSRMERAENELNRTQAYSQLYDTLLDDGYSIINGTFDRYEQTVFSKIAADDNITLSSYIQQLNEEQQRMIGQYCKAAVKSGIKENDLARLRGELNNYFVIEFEKRHKKWTHR